MRKPYSVELKPRGNVFGAQAGAYGTLLNDVHGCSQRSGAQQKCYIPGFFGRHAPADLNPAAADFLPDNRRGNHLSLIFLDQQYRHALADIIVGQLAEDPRAIIVQIEVHGWLIIVVETCLGVIDPIARQHHLFFHQYRAAAALGVKLGAEGDLTAQCRVHFALLIHHAHLQRGGATEDVLGLGGVLHAGQLHNHAVDAGLLNDGFSHPQLIDAVTKRSDVLLNGRILYALLCFWRKRGSQVKLGFHVLLAQAQIGVSLVDFGFRLGPRFGTAKFDDNQRALLFQPGIRDFLLPQAAAYIRAISVKRLGKAPFISTCSMK